MAGEKQGNARQSRSLTPEEGRALFDRAARQGLHMSGEEFVRKYRAGQMDCDLERPDVMQVAMLLPLVEK